MPADKTSDTTRPRHDRLRRPRSSYGVDDEPSATIAHVFPRSHPLRALSSLLFSASSFFLSKNKMNGSRTFYFRVRFGWIISVLTLVRVLVC